MGIIDFFHRRYPLKFEDSGKSKRLAPSCHFDQAEVPLLDYPQVYAALLAIHDLQLRFLDILHHRGVWLKGGRSFWGIWLVNLHETYHHNLVVLVPRR